jgi:uncharacterized protein (TIGR02118 family)
MSVSYFVRYDIEIADLEAFMRRYRDVHVPLVARWPGLCRMVLHTPLAWRDPFPVNPGKAVLVAQLEFEDQAAMNAAFASRERAEAREDFKRFPRYEGTVVHQAMAQDEVYRAPWLDGNEEGA